MRKTESQSNLKQCSFNIPIDLYEALKQIQTQLKLPNQTITICHLIEQERERQKQKQHFDNAQKILSCFDGIVFDATKNK